MNRQKTDSYDWHPYVRQYGLYDPIMVGSIDGTDDVPHDRAINRALSSKYRCKQGSSDFPLESTIFIGRLPYFTEESCLRTALIKLLDNHSEHFRRSHLRSSTSNRTRVLSQSRSRSPFAERSLSELDELVWPKVHIVTDFVTGYPCGYAFACFAQPEDADRLLRNWFRSAVNDSTTEHLDLKGSTKRLGLDIPDGEKVILEPAFGGTLPGWKPRRLGGGLGGRKEAGQLRFGGVARPFRRPFRL